MNTSTKSTSQSSDSDANRISADSTISLRVSGDHYLGAPQFRVKVNGQYIGEVYTVSAIHADGVWEDFNFSGDFGDLGPGSVEVEFLNDQYDGPGKDRNLIVDSMQVNGATYTAADASYKRGYDGKMLDGQSEMAWSGTLAFDTSDAGSGHWVEGVEDGEIALDLELSTNDSVYTHGEVIVRGVPDGGHLSSGYQNAEGDWVVDASEVNGLSLTPPADASGRFDLDIETTGTDPDTGEDTTTVMPISVRVVASADAAVIKSSAVQMDEDTQGKLDLGVLLTDTDGSEQIESIVVSGLPDSVTLSSGTLNEDNSWSLTVDDLDDLRLNTGQHSDEDFNLNVAVTTRETGTESVATTSTDIAVTVNAVADGVVITPPDDLSIIRMRISGEGFVTEKGMFNGVPEFNVYVDGQQIGGPYSANANFALESWETFTLQGDFGATGPESVSVEFTNDVWCKPNCADRTLLVDWIEVNGHVYESEIDARYLRYALDGDDNYEHCDEFGNPIVPDEALPQAWLDGREQMDWNGRLVFNTTSNGGPQGAQGLEDEAIALNVDIDQIDDDGSEKLASIIVSGLPAGALLSAGVENANGSWSLTADQLAGLTVTPPLNSDKEFDVTISVVSQETENGDQIENTVVIPVTVDAVADAPSIKTSDATGIEGEPIALDIQSLLSDVDGSESLHVVLSDIPPGSVLSAGSLNEQGNWVLSADELTDLTIVTPEHVDGDITITATAVTTESDNGDQASSSAPITLTIAGHASQPKVTTEDSAGKEDSAIALNIKAQIPDSSEQVSVQINGVPAGATLSAGALQSDGSWILSLQDVDGLTVTPAENDDSNFTIDLAVTATEPSSGDQKTTQSSLQVNVDAVADAPTLSFANGDGQTSVVTLQLSGHHYQGKPEFQVFIDGEQVGGTYHVSADNYNGESETFTFEGNFNGVSGPQSVDVVFLNDYYEGATKDRNLIVENVDVNGTSFPVQDAEFVRSYDGASLDGRNVMAWSGTMKFQTDDNAGPATPAGFEDSPIDLGLDLSLVDIDGSEALANVIVTGIPDGAKLSAGVLNDDGSWTLAPDELSGLTITPAPHSNDDLLLTIKATSIEKTGDKAETLFDLPVKVTGVADQPLLETQQLQGKEDSAIAVSFDSKTLDQDGSETLSYRLENIPQGGVLSAGLALGDGAWLLTSADLVDLSLTPPENFSGELRLNVVAISTENDGDSAQTESEMTIMVDAVADAAAITRKTARGNEDGEIALSIRVAPQDDDGSERVGMIVLSGIPLGALLNHGIDNGDGSWTLNNDELEGLVITAPKDDADDFRIKISAQTIDENGDSRVTVKSMKVVVKAVADEADVAAEDVYGAEDAPIKLDMSASLTDTDGSESLTVIISGMPMGAVLSSGIDNGDGTWTVPAQDLSELTLTPPRHFNGRLDLEISTQTQESEGDIAHSAAPFSAYVKGVADVAHMDVRPAKGLEDQSIALDIRIGLLDTDGSESMTIEIGNVPDLAMLSAGTQLANGNWLVTNADLDGLSIQPPPDSNVDFTLTVTATTQENDGDTRQTTMALPVTVTGVADQPTAVANDVKGDEDTVIALDLAGAVNDIDGSETVSIVLAGLPAGARLSSGLYNGNGTWTIDPIDLASLTLTPPRDFSGDIDMTMRVISTENDGDAASIDVPYTVHVKGVVDTPGQIAAHKGTEDTGIPINIIPRTTDIDGSESVTLAFVSGVPTGATLSAGTEISSGVWQLEPQDFEGLVLVPAYNSNVDFTLSIGLTVTEEDGATRQFARELKMDLVGDADAPDVWAYNVDGSSNQPVALDFGGRLNDTDGSETLYYIIEDVPKGSYLSAGFNNGDGTWTVLEKHLEDLSLTAPFDYSGEIKLGLMAVARENDGDIATTPTSFTLNVSGEGGGGIRFFGYEDESIGIDLKQLEVRDVKYFTIEGVPEGAKLSAGELDADGNWVVGADQIDSLTLHPEQHSDSDFQLNISWVDSNGKTDTQSAAVVVLGVADTPTLTFTTEGGLEDSAIAITVSGELIDLDGSEQLSFVVNGLPVGATLSSGYLNPISNVWTLTPADMVDLTVTPPQDFSGDLNFHVGAVATELSGDYAVNLQPVVVSVEAVADEATIKAADVTTTEDVALPLGLTALSKDIDGSEKVTAVSISDLPVGAVLIGAINNNDGTWTVDPDSLGELQVVPPENAHGAFSVTVSVTTTEPNGDSAVTDKTVSFSVGSDPDAPSVTAVSVAGFEDAPVSLDLSASLIDQDGSEVMSIRIDGIPDGATLSAGFNNGDGTWTLTPQQVDGLSLSPPADFSGDLEMAITGITLELDTGETAQTDPIPFTVSVAGVADTPSIDPQSSVGYEDTGIPVFINAQLADTDGSETLSVLFTNLPDGATLSAGSLVDEGWLVPGDALDGLTVTPPAQSDANMNLDFTVTATEADGSSSSVSNSVKISVHAVADTAQMSSSTASGEEESAIALNLSVDLIDQDGSELVETIVTGVPTGGTLSHGIDNGDGSWTVDPADVASLTMTPPQDFSGDIAMTLITTTAEQSNGSTATDTLEFNVSVSGVADEATVSVGDSTTLEDQAVQLNLAAHVTDADGSEMLEVVISGVPVGATLSHGVDLGDGKWQVQPTDVSQVQLTAPEDFSGKIDLTLTTTTRERDSNSSTTSTAAFAVNVVAVADAPTLAVSDAQVEAGSDVVLDIKAATTDIDGSEQLTVIVAGVPDTATLSAGTRLDDGSWQLTQDELEGLSLDVADGASAAIELDVTAISADVSGDSIDSQAQLTVTVTPAVVESSTDQGGAAQSGDSAEAQQASGDAASQDQTANDTSNADSTNNANSADDTTATDDQSAVSDQSEAQSSADTSTSSDTTANSDEATTSASDDSGSTDASMAQDSPVDSTGNDGSNDSANSSGTGADSNASDSDDWTQAVDDDSSNSSQSASGSDDSDPLSDDAMSSSSNANDNQDPMQSDSYNSDNMDSGTTSDDQVITDM